MENSNIPDRYNCDHSSWKERLKKHQEDLKNSEGIMLGCLEDEWDSINWDNRPDKRNNLENISDNPLTILSYFLDFCTYPPPEVLLVIRDMLETYEFSAGDRSLEDVFFGPPKRGVGNYAAQKASDKTFMYQTLQLHKKSEEYKRYNEVDLVAHLKEQGIKFGELALERSKKMKGATPKDKKDLLAHYSKKFLALPIGCQLFASVQDEESFLRQYRRHKLSRTD